MPLAVYVPLLYADYAIVASNVGVWPSARALGADLRRERVRRRCSCCFGLFEVSLVLWQLLPGMSAATRSTLGPTVLIHVLVWGSINFLSDVVLLSVYIDSIERGTLPPN